MLLMVVANAQVHTYYFSTWHLPYIISLIAVEIMYILILNFYFIFLDRSRNNKNRFDDNTVLDQFVDSTLDQKYLF